jgi:signal peptidase I
MKANKTVHRRAAERAEGLTLEKAAQDENGLLRRGERLYSGHVGRSMNPTLCDRDLLEVLPYQGRFVRVGDVVILRAPDTGALIVHRVIAIGAEGIRTRGDNNAQMDPWPLREGDILGQVVAACRGNWRRLIAGGRRGRYYMRWIRGWRMLDRAISWLLHPLYRALARGGWLRALCPAALKPRVIVFREQRRERLRLLMGRRVIGHYDEARGRWEIARPFRLLVDEDALQGLVGLRKDLTGLGDL